MRLHNNYHYSERSNRTTAWADSELYRVAFPAAGIVMKCCYEKINGVKYIRLPGDPVPRTISQIKKRGLLVSKPSNNRL